MGCNIQSTSLPDRNGDRVSRELSGRNKLPNVFLEKSTNSLSSSTKIFCRLGNTSGIQCKLLEYVKIFHHCKWN